MADRKLATTIVIGGAVSGALGSALGRAQSQLRGLGDAMRQLKSRQADLASATGKNTSEYQRLTAQIDRLRSAQSRLAAVERQRAANQQRRDQLSGELGQAVGTAAAVNLPIIGSVQQAAEFGHNLQLIGNTADMTSAQVGQLGAAMMAISRETSTSAPDVQRAMGYLVAAGLDAGQAQEQLGTIAMAAKATGSDVEDVARSAFTLGDALKIQPGNMKAALEALVQAGKEGKFEFRDMAAELPNLGAGFAALKLTGQDAVATMGAALQIARKGTGTSAEAADNLANFMAKLLSPETLNKAEKLGSDLYGVVAGAQARGENPFDAAIAEIDRITRGGDQKLLGELFGDMQVQGFLRPMLQNLDEFRRVRDATLSSSGVIDQDFARMRATLKSQLGEIGGALQRTAITIGNALAPVIGRLNDALVPMLERVEAFVTENPKLVGGVLAAASAITGLAVVVNAGAFAFTYFKDAWLAVKSVGAAFQAGGALASMGTTLTTIGSAIAGIGAGPLIAIGAAIALATGAIVKFWPYIEAFYSGYLSGLGDALSGPFERLKTALSPVGDALGRLWGLFSSLFTPIDATAEELQGATSAGRTFGQIVGSVLGGVIDVVTFGVNAFVWLGEAIGTAAGFIAVNLGGAIDTVTALWPVFELAVTTAWDNLKATVGSVIDWLLAKIQPLMDAVGWVGEKISVVGQGIAQRFEQDWAALVGQQAPNLTISPTSASEQSANLPQPAMRGAGGGTTTNSTTVGTITVQAAPGQSAREVAVEVDKAIRERERKTGRGAMYDPVAA